MKTHIFYPAASAAERRDQDYLANKQWALISCPACKAHVVLHGHHVVGMDEKLKDPARCIACDWEGDVHLLGILKSAHPFFVPLTLPPTAAPAAHPSGLRVVDRFDDMSSDNSRLRLVQQEDGDICVIITNGGGRIPLASVEFCTSMAGGGQSPKTLSALRSLMTAMELENLSSPQRPERT